MENALLRRTELEYTTRETSTRLVLELDGTGEARVKTGIGYLDHMLEQLTFHGLLNLELNCTGDLEVDSHHTVEDTAIALGRGVDQALGVRTGIVLDGKCHLPRDATLVRVALGLSGRPECHCPGSV